MGPSPKSLGSHILDCQLFHPNHTTLVRTYCPTVKIAKEIALSTFSAISLSVLTDSYDIRLVLKGFLGATKWPPKTGLAVFHSQKLKDQTMVWSGPVTVNFQSHDRTNYKH
jgi:hypothetical protein